MNKVYLYNSNNELLREFENVITWGYNFVEFDNGGRCKLYCDTEAGEYYTNVEVENGTIEENN